MKFRKFNFKGQKSTDEERVSKIVYITAICLLMGIVVLAAFTSAANRARNPEKTSEGTTVEATPTTKAPESLTPPPADTGVSESVPVFTLPIEGILGMKHDPDMQVKNLTTGDWRVHTGIDIMCEDGASVYCSAEGTVSQVYEDPMMGFCVSVKHAGGYTTVYKNLSPSHADGIAVGNPIRTGQLIGTVGDSALLEVAEEPHLHFSVFLDDEELDPLDCLTSSALNDLGVEVVEK